MSLDYQNDQNNLASKLPLVPVVLVVGTLFIGRRYFATLLPNRGGPGDNISNPISRRRRIAKYPVPRRLPVLITPATNTTNQTCDCIKKSNLSIPEDPDSMPAGNRRLPRNNRSGSMASSSSVPLLSNDSNGNRYSPLSNVTGLNNLPPGLETPLAPKHTQFPSMPTDPEVLFEIMMFVFTLFAGGLQFVHLYKSVWWLPHAYTNQTLNFYLIDPHLVIFILIIISRRLLYLTLCHILQKLSPLKMYGLLKKILRVLLLITIFAALFWCVYHIAQNHHVVNMCYLSYPVLVYLVLFRLNATPFLELLVPSEAIYLDGNPLHSCNSNPNMIRSEVDVLKTDFNNRMKQILLNTVVNAYYCGFAPCCFAQSFVYYDVYWVSQHMLLISLSCFTMYIVHVLPIRYCDVLHRASLHLGGWKRIDPPNSRSVSSSGGRSGSSIPSWTPDILWPAGTIVRHGPEVFKALGMSNAAEPGSMTHSRFYMIFQHPTRTFRSLLIFQLSFVVIQLGVLSHCSYWYHIVSLAIILFANYYILFKFGRDYLVARKIYKNL